MCVVMCDAQQPSVYVCLSAASVFLSIQRSIISPHSSPANPVILVPVGVADLTYSVFKYLLWPSVSVITNVKDHVCKIDFLAMKQLDKARKNALEWYRQCFLILSFAVLVRRMCVSSRHAAVVGVPGVAWWSGIHQSHYLPTSSTLV